MRRLVVALDLSPASGRVLASAAELAHRLGLSLVLLHVVPDPVLAPALTQDVRKDVQDAQEQLRILAQGIVDVEVEIAVVRGEDTAKTVCNYAASHRAEWLAIGVSGRSALTRTFLGSVAEAVLRHSSVPVICYPTRDAPAG